MVGYGDLRYHHIAKKKSHPKKLFYLNIIARAIIIGLFFFFFCSLEFFGLFEIFFLLLNIIAPATIIARAIIFSEIFIACADKNV